MLLARSLSPLALLAGPRRLGPGAAPRQRALALPAARAAGAEPRPERVGPSRPRYWQQRVDYRIRATLDPASARAARHARRFTTSIARPTRCPTSGCSSSRTSARRQRHQPAQPAAARLPRLDLRLLLQGLRRRAPPGARCGSGLRRCTPPVTARRCGSISRGRSRRARRSTSTSSWRFTVPDYGAGRMGRDGTLYEIAQWYPRLAVYDDVRGLEPRAVHRRAASSTSSTAASTWRSPCRPTTSSRATGELRNPAEVLTATQRSRLARAAELGRAGRDHHRRGGRRRRRRPGRSASGTLTWRFTADSVRDFAFARRARTSAGTRAAIDGMLVQTLYRPSAARVGGGEPDGARGDRVLQRAVVSAIPTPHITQHRGADRGDGVPDDHLRSPRARAARSGSGCWPTSSATSGSRWSSARTSGSIPGWTRGSTPSSISATRRAYFKGTPYGDTIEVHPLHLYPDHADPGQGAAADQPPGGGARPLLDRLPEAGADDADAPLRGARQGALRRRVPRVHPGLGVQAPDARPTSSGSCATRRGWISTGSGATGSTPRRGWIRRWTRSAWPRGGRRSSSPTAAR